MRSFGLFLVAIVGVIAAAFFFLRTSDTDFEEMRAKYGPPPSAFLDANGMRIHYRDEGCRTCQPIILMHGSNASLHTFEPLVALLGNRHRIITYDHQGHGLSGQHPQNDYSATALADTLNAVAEEVGVETFVLGGNSMGGWAAWRYALARPDRVEALILMNASGAPKPADAPDANIYLAARIMRHPAGRWFARHFIPRAIVEKSALQSVADPDFVTEEMVDGYWELARLPDNRRALGFRAAVSREPEYGARLGEISVPTLIIWGAKDEVTPT
jgi:pimeloyl-ACP methyl ester carboxylesterase